MGTYVLPPTETEPTIVGNRDRLVQRTADIRHLIYSRGTGSACPERNCAPPLLASRGLGGESSGYSTVRVYLARNRPPRTLCKHISPFIPPNLQLAVDCDSPYAAPPESPFDFQTRIPRAPAYIPGMRWRSSSSVRPASGFIEPCLPTKAARAPVGSVWVYEIKHDGYRLMVRKDGERVRVYTRRGADWTERFPRIVAAARRLKVQSILLDGEGIVFDAKGMPSFALLHSRDYDREASLAAFDLLELDGEDLRKLQLLERKTRLARLLSKVKDGIQYNDHMGGDGAIVFEHACKLGHEGIVAKRKDLPYESGRSKRWLKIKNPDSPAMKRIEDGSF